MHHPQPKRAIVLGSYIFSLINFRKHLLEALVNSGYEVLALAPGYDEAVISQLRAIGVRYQHVTLSRTGFNPWEDLKTISALRGIFRTFDPDLLITYTIKPVIYGNIAARLKPRMKTLALITGLGYLDTGAPTFRKRLVQRVIHALYRFALKRLAFIAFQNPDDQYYFMSRRLIGPGTAMTITAGSGVDLKHYTRTPAVLQPVVFLLIARLIRAKGIVQFLEAAEILKNEHREKVRFQVVGLPDEHNPDSIDMNEVQQLADRGIIEYLGFQKDVRAGIAAASVFVLPSYYREGTPRTILEAMAMGKAIITTDNPGCRETVKDGHNGFIVPVRDAPALVQAMQRYIADPKLIVDMGEASYRLAQSKYDVHLVNQHLFSFASL
ncbi:MAG TPA: glycosyltransferase family 4 protein [Ohtaekwangia sp.]|nr:glycosyltransferase family 4 protein [Ohtaekwangia sp.]